VKTNEDALWMHEGGTPVKLRAMTWSLFWQGGVLS